MAQDDAIEEDSVVSILANLTERARNLLAELETFRQHLRVIRQEGQVELASFRSTLQSELGMLERLSQKTDSESRTQHIARSSNLPFLETVWGVAKKNRSLAALQKRIYYNSPHKSLSQAMHHVNLGNNKCKETDRKNAAVTVDGITHGGSTWVKVSLVTNTRLLFDLAKQGWQSEGSDDEENGEPLPDEESDVPLVKSSREVCLAAQSYRVRTRMPVVHLVLPRIQPAETDEVDDILEQCRAAGAIVFCGEDLSPVPSIEEALATMAPDPLSTFSDVLNIDCTILLALVSEFSHAKVSKEPWFHKALQRQVEIEGNQNLLPSLLYPALCNHELICTKEAAKRMREIVGTIGTPSEKARTAIMMGDDPSKSQLDLVREMQEWSAHEVPESWQLPIQIVDSKDNDAESNLPAEAKAVAKDMTAINKSVFLYGWANGFTTITSNRTVVKQMESELEKFEDLDETIWPKIWLCPTARSLVGKESRSVKREDRKGGAWPLPDPLRREEQRRNGLDVLSERAGEAVADLRPNGYPCDEVIEAKNEARRRLHEGK